MKLEREYSRMTVVATCVLAALFALATPLGCSSADDAANAEKPSDPQGIDLTRVGNPEPELPINTLRSLKTVRPAEPKDLGSIVRDRAAAIVLGKAFFWDAQAGSDGQACASCHAHAGADNRTKNQLSPGMNNLAGPPLSQTFDRTADGKGGPNYTLRNRDFPFHQLSDPNDPESTVTFDTDDVVSSQGVFRRTFVSTTPDSEGRDTCTDATDFFVAGKKRMRRVEPRNTPTVINAALFDRSFWDGRANNAFNGVTPFGPRDPAASILELQLDGTTREVRMHLENAALGSQAVGPILSGFEMSCEGRSLADVGHKLRSRRALALQDVAADDSVLGPLRDASGKGLTLTYEELIQRTFDSKYWASPAPTASGNTQLERNFGLFWGLSIMLYEGTLLSDDAPIDRYLEGNKKALTAQQLYGKSLFEGPAGCINCHHGPAISGAAFAFSQEFTETNPIERMAMNDGRVALYDNGFYNIGVRSTTEDIGVGGSDPWGNPLSLAREAKRAAGGGPAALDLRFDSSRFVLNRGQDPQAGEREATDGCFKTPTLRNVELTGPYFHNGGQATLEQVIDFYNRGGDRRGGKRVSIDGEQTVTGKDSTAYGANDSNMDADVQRLFLPPQAKAAIVAFLKSFTDERVRWERAPFDHPALSLPNGDASGPGPTFIQVPAVGAGGRSTIGLGPLKPFQPK